MGKSGHVRQFETDGVSFEVYDETSLLVIKAGLGPIFHWFNSYNLSWCYDFIHSFDGNTTWIRDVKFTITEDSIAEAMGFPTKAEKWFKKQMMQDVDLNFFRNEEY